MLKWISFPVPCETPYLKDISGYRKISGKWRRWGSDATSDTMMLWVIWWCYQGDSEYFVSDIVWLQVSRWGNTWNGWFVSYNNDVEPGARQQSHLEKEEGRSVSEAFASTKCSEADGWQLGTPIIRIPLQSAQGPTNQTMYIHHVCRAPARHRKP